MISDPSNISGAQPEVHRNLQLLTLVWLSCQLMRGPSDAIRVVRHGTTCRSPRLCWDVLHVIAEAWSKEWEICINHPQFNPKSPVICHEGLFMCVITQDHFTALQSCSPSVTLGIWTTYCDHRSASFLPSVRWAVIKRPEWLYGYRRLRGLVCSIHHDLGSPVHIQQHPTTNAFATPTGIDCCSAGNSKWFMS